MEDDLDSKLISTISERAREHSGGCQRTIHRQTKHKFLRQLMISQLA